VKSLANETIKVTSSDCSLQMMELIPVIMRRITNEMRLRTMTGLTVPQYRTLNYIQRHSGTSLSDLAGFLGLTLPSTSKLVQKFVTQKIIERKVADDRRRVCLTLTPEGTEALAGARLGTREKLMEILNSLTPDELNTLSDALQILNAAFSGGDKGVGLHKTV
jgi:DNA-binding MarR family transcriptional regulator